MCTIIDTVQKLRFGNIFNAFIFFWWSENCMLGVWINQEFKSSLALYTWILGMKSLNFWNVDNSSFRRISMWANHWHKKIFLSNSYSYSIKISNSWDTNTYSQFWKSSPKKLIYYSLINLHKLLSAKGIDIIYLLQKNLNTYLFLYVRFRAKNRLL